MLESQEILNGTKIRRKNTTKVSHVGAQCGGGAFAPAEWSPDSADVEGLAVPWDVPRGRLAHHRTVEATTAAVIVLSAVAVAVAALASDFVAVQ